MIIFKKEYDGESIVDLERDISECLDGNFNAIAYAIPVDEHGIHKGTFKVTVEWDGKEVLPFGSNPCCEVKLK